MEGRGTVTNLGSKSALGIEANEKTKMVGRLQDRLSRNFKAECEANLVRPPSLIGGEGKLGLKT